MKCILDTFSSTGILVKDLGLDREKSCKAYPERAIQNCLVAKSTFLSTILYFSLLVRVHELTKSLKSLKNSSSSIVSLLKKGALIEPEVGMAWSSVGVLGIEHEVIEDWMIARRGTAEGMWWGMIEIAGLESGKWEMELDTDKGSWAAEVRGLDNDDDG